MTTTSERGHKAKAFLRENIKTLLDFYDMIMCTTFKHVLDTMCKAANAFHSDVRHYQSSKHLLCDPMKITGF